MLPDLYGVQESLARRSLRDFVAQSWHVVEPGTPFVPNWHIDAISDHLEAVSRRDIKRLIINIPPRHMKSILVAVNWPAWEWIERPHTQWLFASYALTLSIRDSVKCRRLIQSPWYQERWGDRFQLTDDQNQKMRFENTHTGYRLATAVDGGLTGEGAGIICIDDPHNAVEGESKTVRESTLNWWDTAMSTRLNDPKTGAYVVIMQRLHDRDLVGHILAKNHGWDHLCLPARYESDHPTPVRSSISFRDPRTTDGELLWPERMGEKELKDLETTLGSYGTAGQMQQRPAPAGGGIFKREWFKRYADKGDHYMLLGSTMSLRVPKDRCYLIATSDLAMTAKEQADYSVIQVWAVTPQGHMLLIHMWRDQVEAPDTKKQLALTCKERDIRFIGVEDEPRSRAIIQMLRREGMPVRPLKPSKDKVARAQLASIWMEDGRIWLPEHATWLQVLEDELTGFPNAEHDDTVDCVSYAALLVRDQPEPEDDGLPKNLAKDLLKHDEVIAWSTEHG